MSVVADNSSIYGKGIYSLPILLKNRLTKLMSRRGCFDRNVLANCITANISALDLTNCTVDDEILNLISKTCEHLRKINLNSPKGKRTDFTSDGVVYLSEGCKRLKSVFLRYCSNIEDVAVVALANSCPLLKRLNLKGTKVTDTSLNAITKLVHLESLTFSNSQVTDEGVRILSESPCARKLFEIDMSECTNLTDEAVKFVATNCPSFEILIFHGCPKMTQKSRSILDNFARISALKQLTWTIY